MKFQVQKGNGQTTDKMWESRVTHSTQGLTSTELVVEKNVAYMSKAVIDKKSNGTV